MEIQHCARKRKQESCNSHKYGQLHSWNLRGHPRWLYAGFFLCKTVAWGQISCSSEIGLRGKALISEAEVHDSGAKKFDAI